MKSVILYLILFFSFAINIDSQTITLDGTVYDVDTLENHQVGPSTRYLKLHLAGPSTKRLDVYFLIANVRDPYITVRAALGRDSIYGGERPSATAKRLSTAGAFYFAGTNGDFYDTGATYTGYPVSGCMIDGEIAKVPGSRHVYTFDADEQSYIGTINYSGSVTSGTARETIHGVNHTRGENELRLYNRFNGKSTHTNAFGSEAEIELIGGDTWGVNRTLHARVNSIEQGVGNRTIPAGKAVLSGHGSAATYLQSLEAGDEITLELNLTPSDATAAEFRQMTGGDSYAKIIDRGAVVASNFWNELHPRTGLGYSQTGDSVIFCVVDGRSTQSNGCTTQVLGALMQSAGAYTAFNMDGGGSSAMYIDEYGKAVNFTSDGSERAVANSIFVVATCPEDETVASIVPHAARIEAPQYGIFETHFYAYNQYGILLDSDLSGVTLSAPAELGIVDGQRFTCTGASPGILTATYNGIITAQIHVIPTVTAGVNILLDSVWIDGRHDYAIEVSAITATGAQPIEPQMMTWEVDNASIARIENGSLQALSNGTTFAVGSLGLLTDTLYITVETPDFPRIVSSSFTPTSEWTLSTISEWSTGITFDAANRPEEWEHGAAINFTYQSGRAPYVKLTRDFRLYGLPDTVTIVARVGDLQLKEASISLRANHTEKAIAFKIAPPFPTDTDIELSAPIKSLFDSESPSVYPVCFNNVNFTIESTNTIGTNYTLALKEIALIYNGIAGTRLALPPASVFMAYPNPTADGQLFIRLPPANVQGLMLELFDREGRLLQSKNYEKTTSNIVSFHIGKRLPQGIYLLKINTNDYHETIKIIIDK